MPQRGLSLMPQRQEGGCIVLILRYLLAVLGLGLCGSSGALVAYDIYLSSQLRRLLGRRRIREKAGYFATGYLGRGGMPL